MSARYLLDTNICIHALSGRHPAVVERIDDAGSNAVVTSAIVVGELRFGIAKSVRAEQANARLSALLQIVRVRAVGDDVARSYAEIRAELERLGTPIGNNDLWIAAHARAAGLVLVSNNLREFSRVPGLEVENWC